MKGEQQIIDRLNELLKGELMAVDQYLAHGEQYADMGFHKLAAHALHESEHEREHAQAMMQRIHMLEGLPDLSQRHPLNVKSTVPEMLQSDLDVEYQVRDHLKDAIVLCESVSDFVTRDMLAQQLDDTETDHAYWLEKQLRLIDQIGLPNYLQIQMGEEASE